MCAIIRKDTGHGTHNYYCDSGSSAAAHSHLRLWLVVPGKSLSLCAIILCRNCKPGHGAVVAAHLAINDRAESARTLKGSGARLSGLPCAVGGFDPSAARFRKRIRPTPQGCLPALAPHVILILYLRHVSKVCGPPAVPASARVKNSLTHISIHIPFPNTMCLCVREEQSHESSHHGRRRRHTPAASYH
jgi:hypothetical protein